MAKKEKFFSPFKNSENGSTNDTNPNFTKYNMSQTTYLGTKSKISRMEEKFAKTDIRAPKILSVPKNINEYKHLLGNRQFNLSDLQWTLNLRLKNKDEMSNMNSSMSICLKINSNIILKSFNL